MYDAINDKFKDECGVFGMYSKSGADVAKYAYYALYALQHRGQQSAGIAISNGEDIAIHKDLGLLTDAFELKDLEKLTGHISVGHVKYSAEIEPKIENAQPLVSSTKLGSIAIANNGSLVNSNVIKDLLEDSGYVFHTDSDVEVLMSLIARSAKRGIIKSVYSAVQAVRGSFAVVMSTKDQLIGIRDPHGIRPLCIGKIDEDYILSSESCALDAIGAEFVRDVLPGEIVVITDSGLESVIYSEKTQCETCAFEYIYFARPDSTMDGVNVHNARVNAGAMLYKQNPIDADVVIGVPDSGLSSAIGYAKASGIPYDIGFVKNKYIGRTFIAPNQSMRERAVSVKLNPLKVNVEGKRVILVDDSIVRGTTSRHLVESLRRAGAKEVHFKIASPMVKYPCYFGIDTPYRKDLIGANNSMDQIRDLIGVDSLDYLLIDNLLESLSNGCPNKGYCLGCLNGVYPVSTPIEQGTDYLD
ncbi:MAG: amidophosphoribosyltransferase [Sarcina sp.]